MLTGITLGLERGSDLLADILRVVFIDYVSEGKEVILHAGSGVGSFVHGNKSDIVLSQYLSEISGQNVVSTDSAVVLYNDSADVALLDLCNESLKPRAIKGGSGYTIVRKVPDPREAVLFSKRFKKSFLI